MTMNQNSNPHLVTVPVTIARVDGSTATSLRELVANWRLWAEAQVSGPNPTDQGQQEQAIAETLRTCARDLERVLNAESKVGEPR